MSYLFTDGKFHASNADGTPMVGGLLYTDVGGLSGTSKTTYSDSGLTTPNTYPVVLDARGEASVWLGTGAYLMTLKTSAAVTVWTQDGVSDATTSSNLANTSDMTLGVALVGGAGRVVATIAALRALPKAGSPNAFVTGYYAHGDGGGGPYYYDSADTTSADNGGTIIVASDGGRWKLASIAGWDARQFGAKLDGTTDDTTAVQAALTAANGTGKRVTFHGPACSLTTTISLNAYSGFDIDFGACAFACSHGAGVYVFDGTQASNITFSGGQWTGTGNANHFIKTAGSAAAQATMKPSIPAESLWARQLRFSGMLHTGFSTVFDLQSFTREIWITDCYVTGNLTAIKQTGKVVGLNGKGCELYSLIAASQCVVSRGDSSDPTSWRYPEGTQFTDCLAQSVGVPIDLQAGFVFRWAGQQIYSSTLGTAGVDITAGANGANPAYLMKDVLIDALFNSGVVVGTGIAVQTTFAATFRGQWSGVQGTAASILANCADVTVGGQFDSGTGTVIGCAVGATCVGVKFSPDYLDATYQTTPLTVDATSVAGVRANFSAAWVPVIQFGGASTGITYSVQAGRYQWDGGQITAIFTLTLANKGSATGVATISGLPFKALANGVAVIGKYTSFNTAITPFGDVSAAATSIAIKTAGGGSEATVADTAFSNTSVLNGSVSYMVS